MEERRSQIVLLLMLERNQKPDPRRIKEIGAKSEDIKERLEVAERKHDARFVKANVRRAT